MSARGIYGLSGSGIDVDSMVRVGMMTKQNEYDRMYKKEVRQEWTKEAYSKTYSDLSTFANTTMSNYKMSSTLNPQTVSSSRDSVATAVANADAAPMSHTVEVESLATNAYLLTGDEKMTRNAGANAASIKLSDFFDTSKVAEDNPLEITVSDGQNTGKITLTKEQIVDNGETLNDLVSAFNSLGLNIKASYDSTNDSFALYNNTGGASNGIYLTAGTVDSNTHAVTIDDAAKELLDNLNLHMVTTEYEDGVATSKLSDQEVSYTDAGGKWTADAFNGTIGAKTFELTADEATGVKTLKIGGEDYTVDSYTYDKARDTYTVEYKADGTSMTLTLGKQESGGRTVTLTDGASTETGSVAKDAESHDVRVNGGMAGTDATVKIDGKTYTSDTNKVSASNVTYTLLSTGTSKMTVSQDTDKLVENVKKFVEDYNAMLDKLNDLYYEEKYSDYDVLTKSQEKAMSQDQIDKWNEKAKSGLLNHNDTIRKLISNMREAIYTPVDSVDGKYNTLMSIGITSTTDRGHLSLDENKLQKALADDPDCVYQLMGASDPDDDYGKTGIANRIYDTAQATMKEMKSYAGTSTETADGSTLGNLIQDMKKKMSDFATMMDAFEKALYDKYDAMEVAIQRLGVSLGYVSSSTGG